MLLELFMAGTRNKWFHIWLLQSPLNTGSVLWDKRCLLVGEDLGGVGRPDGLRQPSQGLDIHWKAMCPLTLAGFRIVNLYVNIIALENEILSNFF